MSIFDRFRSTEGWLNRLRTGTVEQRAQAIDTLAALPASEVVPLARAALISGVTPAAEVLLRFQAVDALAESARAGADLVPQVAIASLVQLDARDAVRSLIDAGPIPTRRIALGVFVATWGPAILDTIHDPALADAVADERARLTPPPADPRSFEELLAAVDTEGGLAIAHLTRLDDPRVIDALIGLLQQPAYIGPAAHALAARGAREALPALRATQQSGRTPPPVMPTDGDPREMLAEAIRTLS